VRQRLIDWIDTHKTAYPRTQEYERLASETGLSLRQVKNWFVNHRGRQLKKAAADGDLAAGPVRKRIRWVRPEQTETTTSETGPPQLQ
jgi:hypothetical protein